MKCYVLTWDRLVNDDGKRRQEFLDFLDTIPEIVNWRGTVGIILIASDLSGEQIQEKIRARFPKELGFLIFPVNINDTQGYTNKDTWDFIRNPRPIGS
jgi:hypothetical protein